jgi:hypothetical protein
MRSRLWQGSAVMVTLRNPYDQVSVQSIVVARLVSGILDGTYENIEDAQIALERTLQILSKRRSNFVSKPAANDDFEPGH